MSRLALTASTRVSQVGNSNGKNPGRFRANQAGTRRRLPRMHREGWDGPRASSSMAFAWFAWRRGYAGPTILSRI
jgi:hypothetical protein